MKKPKAKRELVSGLDLKTYHANEQDIPVYRTKEKVALTLSVSLFDPKTNVTECIHLPMYLPKSKATMTLPLPVSKMSIIVSVEKGRKK